MIVLFKILTLFCFKAIRSSSLTLNEIMIAFDGQKEVLKRVAVVVVFEMTDALKNACYMTCMHEHIEHIPIFSK